MSFRWRVLLGWVVSVFLVFAIYNVSFADTKDAGAFNNRGLTYYYKGEYDKAIKEYNKAIELNPKYAEAFNNRGLAYRHKGELDRAIKDYNKAIELNPKYAKAFNNRGVAYARRG